MKKIILFFILSIFAGSVLAQFPGTVFQGDGSPSGEYDNFHLNKDLYVDTSAAQYWVSKVASVWNLTSGFGTPTTVNVGTVTTLAPGSSATVVNSGTATNVVLDFGIPRGATGSGGGGGGSWVEDIYTSPDKYGALHDSSTFAGLGLNQAYVDANYPGTGATTADNVDWAAWQMAINDATDTNRAIIGYGTYYVNRQLTIEQFPRQFVIYGNGCMVQATGITPFVIFRRTMPTNQSDADIMTNTFFTIKDITVKGHHVHKGFEMGPTYMSRYDNVKCIDLDSAIIMRYELATYLTNIHVNGNYTCGVFMGLGNWTGATFSNSQCNSSVLESLRFYGTNATSNAVKIFSCSGVWVRNIIIEGSDCAVGINFDGNDATVVHDFNVEGLHFECNPGTSVTAAVKVRMSGGIFALNTAFGQYHAIMVDAGSTTGYVSCKISNVYAWNPTLTGKYFNNNGGTSWIMDWDDQIYGSLATMPNMFQGVAVSVATLGTMGNGNNTITAVPIPR